MNPIETDVMEGKTVESQIDRSESKTSEMSLLPPRIVDMKSLAAFIKHPKCKSIVVLTGAGASTGSGIPDFRSPGGMYKTLQPNLLTASEADRELLHNNPTCVVSWDLFARNPFPYLEVRRPFILGTRDQKWKATITHKFCELLHTKTTIKEDDNGNNSNNNNNSNSKLTRVYTQNIDGLHDQCKNLPKSKIVHAHGSISDVSCEGCGSSMDFDLFCDKVRTQIKDIYNIDSTAPEESSKIYCGNCNQPLVKPTTVMFGRALPNDFFTRSDEDMPTTDLLIVAGTSLVVSPVNSLVNLVPEPAYRVIFNREPVGFELGLKCHNDFSDPNNLDLFQGGDCDKLFLELIKELGWLDDFAAMALDSLPPESQKLLREAIAEEH